MLVLLSTQLLKSAATITTLGHKQMDADSQARQLLDRMAIDFAKMVRRSDIDYYVKSSALSPLRNVRQPGNDQIAFYGSVEGYFPTSSYQSPLSVVAYRVNSNSSGRAYNTMERMGVGLLWNAAPVVVPSATPTPSVTPTPAPVVFLPVPLASPLPIGDLTSPTPNPLPTPAWPQAGCTPPSCAWSTSDSEVIGPQVFRFEYYYLLNDGTFSDIPWQSPHSSVSGMQDVVAIVVAIAVIDPKSKVLLDAVDPTGAKLARLNGADGQLPLLSDFSPSFVPGQLLAWWQQTLDGNIYPNGIRLPAPVRAGIRVYERFIYLSSPVL
ncbi:MAG TPA: hypothetical protein VFW94_02695 [Candidatus Acidoferrales bacterium]|nr:hypothetical protein [Candidatus Acidoferrales bacterium]